jgi:4-hydroxybenzoate polyprenyltransferase
VAILDVLILASGFVLRAYAGGLAIEVTVSHWLLLCTLTLSLFLGFAKRESERVALGETASATRPLAWSVYSRETLAHMMTVSAGLAIVTYMLYTVDQRTVTEVVGDRRLFVTVLPVMYAVFRFYHMAITGRAGDPVDMVRRDPAFVVALIVWVAMVGGLLFAA